MPFPFEPCTSLIAMGDGSGETMAARASRHYKQYFLAGVVVVQLCLLAYSTYAFHHRFCCFLHPLLCNNTGVVCQGVIGKIVQENDELVF